jgi:CheY-like chemotaxis protein
MVSVGDNGTGIPLAILDKVFDPFFTTKEIGKGSGLGLSQVLGVAQQLGGGVLIETRPGAGTTVSVYLPRVRGRAAGPSSDSTPRAALQGDEDRRDRLILLVDDDSDVRAVTSSMLDDAGYQVIEADSSAAALECLERQDRDIALMVADIAMPGMSGIELARAARCMRPELPVVFVTGFAGAAMPPAGANPGDGSNRLLRKPFRAAELAAMVASALDESRDAAGLLPLR